MPKREPCRGLAEPRSEPARSRIPDGERSPIHARLRAETRAVHQRLEARLNLLDPGLERQRYRRVLEAFYGFYLPLEARLARAPASEPPCSFPLPARAALLERDLVALGWSPGQLIELPRCVRLPELRRAEQLAGCLYVVEGASLGGQVLSRAFARRLGLAASSGAAFFTGDGEGTLPRWRRVLGWLHELAAAGAHGDEIVRAACETFVTLEHWLRDRGAAP